jgi:hypothetical protein
MHAPQNLRDRRPLLQLPRLSSQPPGCLRNLKKKSHALDGCGNGPSAPVKTTFRFVINMQSNFHCYS